MSRFSRAREGTTGPRAFPMHRMPQLACLLAIPAVLALGVGAGAVRVDVDLVSLFFGDSSMGQWTEVTIRNLGDHFGIDELSCLASVPVVTGAAPMLAGTAGRVGLRRRPRR